MTEPQGTPPAPIGRCRVCARPLDADTDVQLYIDSEVFGGSFENVVFVGVETVTGIHYHCVPQPEEEKHDRHDG